MTSGIADWGLFVKKLMIQVATKPFRDIPREIGDIFKLPDLEDQFQKSKLIWINPWGPLKMRLNQLEAMDETFGDESEDPAPPVLGAVPLGAAIYSQEYEDEENKKRNCGAELTMNSSLAIKALERY